jgi:hypothetical protein
MCQPVAQADMHLAVPPFLYRVARQSVYLVWGVWDVKMQGAVPNRATAEAKAIGPRRSAQGSGAPALIVYFGSSNPPSTTEESRHLKPRIARSPFKLPLGTR